MKGAGDGTRKKHSPELVVRLLRQLEVAGASGNTKPAACQEGGIAEQTNYHWRQGLGGMWPIQLRFTTLNERSPRPKKACQAYIRVDEEGFR